MHIYRRETITVKLLFGNNFDLKSTTIGNTSISFDLNKYIPIDVGGFLRNIFHSKMSLIIKNPKF